MKNIHSLFVAFLLFVSIASSAQISSPRADARQHAQRKRIAVGRHDGELTRREATYLHREQRHIHMSERRAEADGKVRRSFPSARRKTFPRSVQAHDHERGRFPR